MLRPLKADAVVPVDWDAEVRTSNQVEWRASYEEYLVFFDSELVEGGLIGSWVWLIESHLFCRDHCVEIACYGGSLLA